MFRSSSDMNKMMPPIIIFEKYLHCISMSSYYIACKCMCFSGEYEIRKAFATTLQDPMPYRSVRT